MASFLDGFSFEPLPPPTPWTLEEIRAFIEEAEKAKKRIVCSTDAYERISALVAAEGYGAYFKVIASPLLEPGQVFVMQSEADDEAEMQRLAERLTAEIAENAQREYEDYVRREQFKAELRESWAIGARVTPPWTPIITGL